MYPKVIIASTISDIAKKDSYSSSHDSITNVPIRNHTICDDITFILESCAVDTIPKMCSTELLVDDKAITWNWVIIKRTERLENNYDVERMIDLTFVSLDEYKLEKERKQLRAGRGVDLHPDDNVEESE